jgi:superfamily II DNA helicase RecQ
MSLVGHMLSFIQGIPRADGDTAEPSGVIYTYKRGLCDDLANTLRDKGLSVAAYHAGLTKDQRGQLLKDWTKGTVKIVVATVAFGMGIDKVGTIAYRGGGGDGTGGGFDHLMIRISN